MNLKELRIGNYVLVENEKAEVISIGNNDALLTVKYPGDKIEEIPLATATPIVLGSEMLGDCCDFDELGKHMLDVDHHRHFLKLQNGYIALQNKKNETIIHFWEIKYMHQLQNLYYALKGKEMKVAF